MTSEGVQEAQRLHLAALKMQLEAAQALTEFMRRQYEEARSAAAQQ